MEEGETPPQTALREVAEETGVNGLEIVKELLPTFHTYRLDGQRVIKETHWFEIGFPDDSNMLTRAEQRYYSGKMARQKRYSLEND